MDHRGRAGRAKTAEHLPGSRGFDRSITLVGESRCPLRAAPVQGDLMGSADARTRRSSTLEQWYADNAVDLVLGSPGHRRGPRQPHGNADDREIPFTKLALTTRRIGRAGWRSPGPICRASITCGNCRTPDSCGSVRRGRPDRRWVPAGSGSRSAAARQAGVDVTVVEAAELPLLAVLGPQMAEVFATGPPQSRRRPSNSASASTGSSGPTGSPAVRLVRRPQPGR